MKGKIALLIFAAIILLAVSLQSGRASDYATVQDVDAWEEWLLYVPLNEGDVVDGNFTVYGRSLGIYFSVIDTQDSTILDLDRVNDANTFGFTAQESGTYTLNFSNPSMFGATISLSFHTPAQLNTSPTPQPTTVSPTYYVFFGMSIFFLVMTIVVAVYATAKSRGISGLSGLDRELKILQSKLNFTMVGICIGAFVLISSIAYLSTPFYVWGTFLPDAIMQVIDPNVYLLGVLSLFLMLVGFGVLFGMIGVMIYYGRKVKKKQDQISSAQSKI